MYLSLKAYDISNVKLKVAKPMYQLKDGSTFDIELNSDTVIKESENAIKIVSEELDIVTIKDVMLKPLQSEVSFYAIVASAGECEERTRQKDGVVFHIREIDLIDESTEEVLICVLWNNQAVDFKFNEDQVVFVKKGIINFYNYRTVSISPTSMIVMNPDNDRADELKTWNAEQKF